MVTQVQEPPKHASNVRCYAVNQLTSLLATGRPQEVSINPSFFGILPRAGDYWRVLLSHADAIPSLLFSNDGVLLASGGDDRTTIVWDVASGRRLYKLGPHDSCNDILAFSENNTHLTMRTNKECFVWEFTSGEQLERRDRDMFGDGAPTTPYYLKDLNGWQTVVSASQRKKCKYGLCRALGEYGASRFYHGPIFGDRAALFCADGGVLILDISRVVHVVMDPARQIDLYSW